MISIHNNQNRIYPIRLAQFRSCKTSWILKKYQVQFHEMWNFKIDKTIKFEPFWNWLETFPEFLQNIHVNMEGDLRRYFLCWRYVINAIFYIQEQIKSLNLNLHKFHSNIFSNYCLRDGSFELSWVRMLICIQWACPYFERILFFYGALIKAHSVQNKWARTGETRHECKFLCFGHPVLIWCLGHSKW